MKLKAYTEENLKKLRATYGPKKLRDVDFERFLLTIGEKDKQIEMLKALIIHLAEGSNLEITCVVSPKVSSRKTKK